MLDVCNRQIVIIGGGAVAARKAKTLLEAGATRVRMIARAFDPKMPAGVERITKAYESRDLDGADLAYAATDSPDVNTQVVRDARSRSVLVNRLDEGEPPGDFITPAGWRQGEVVLAVSAGSAALAVAIRDDLATSLDDRHVRMSEVMADLRPQIRDSGVDQQKRAAIFRELASDAALDALARDGEGGLRLWLSQRYPELKL